MPHKIVILGGSGFVGSSIARVAAEHGQQVVSISRRGRPKHDEPWHDAVEWVEGNVFHPETWRAHLDGAHSVVHCIGTIREQPEEGVTFERVNGDSVEIAAFEAEQAGVERFVMLSAHETPPFVSERYLDAKQRGERALERSPLQAIVLRPAFIYGPDRPLTLLPGGLLGALKKLPFLSPQDRPLRVEQVAEVAVQAATDLDYEGGISVENIAYLAGEMWKYHRRPTLTLKTLRPYLIGTAALGAVAGTAVALGKR